MEYYESALKIIERIKGTDIQFPSITPDWLRSFKTALTNEKKSYTTIAMYQRAIRAITNRERQNRMMKGSAYPFGEGRKFALTLSQIKQIMDYSE